MKDRRPTMVLENGAVRYGIYDELGTLLRYEYIRPEDAPTQLGTPLTKMTLLSDETAEAIGLEQEDPTVNDALAGLASGKQDGLTGQKGQLLGFDESGKPLAQDPPEGVGRSMAGQTVEPVKGTTATAGEGAEIFNDYRPRTFGTDSNPNSTAVRDGNIASGAYSHAEGEGSTASGDYSHAEGRHSTASGTYSHAEGFGTASGNYAHAEAGGKATGAYSHAEGTLTQASGNASHAEGNSTKATSIWAHAEGYNTEASGNGSHAEGSTSKATGYFSHAEGASTEAGGSSVYGCAHAEGFYTTASGDQAHSEGYYTTASGVNSHAEGYYAEAKGRYSHAGNSGTIAAGTAQTAIGEANVESSSSTDKFIIGKGTFWAPGSSYNTTRSNCFRVTTVGVYASGNYNASGADYAELFEWADGNPNNCDWVGRFVTLDGAKIRLAGPLDDYILGIVSGCPSVVGDVYDDQWQGMYLNDIFGRPIMEDVEVPDVTETFPDPENPENTITRVIIPAHTERRQKLNPSYDNSQKYVPRSERPEWAAVGLLGKLVALEDGSCAVGGYCAAGEGGVATASQDRTAFRVMEKLTDPETGTKCVRVMILPEGRR